MYKDDILLCLSKILDKDTEELKRLPENAPTSDIGLESIAFISFVVELEKTFGFEVSDRDLVLTNFDTLSKTYETLQKYFAPENTAQTLKKCLILDCDGVLWKGVAGEEKIAIDDGVIQFQNELVKLYENGVLLCLCSKNEPDNITEAFRRPDMILKREHIVISKINAKDKIENIKEIAAELNLSTDSFVFADDDPYEIGLVNSFMSEVETVKVDYNNNNFIENIANFFNTDAISQDLNRTKLYIEQKERIKSLSLFNSVEEYNASLGTKIICDTTGVEHIDRIAELSQRTNQFNLSGRHYSKEEIEKYIKDGSYKVLYLSASDKYGDMGIAAAAVVQKLPDCAVIENFMLSCRVFGRGFEYIMLDKIKVLFKNSPVWGIFKLTEKNKKHSNFYAENGVKLWQTATK